MDQNRFKNDDILEELVTAKIVAKISQKIETDEFFQELLFYSQKLARAKAGFVYLLEGVKNMALSASTIPAGDHLHETFSKLDFETIRKNIGVEARIMSAAEILFPFSALIAEHGSLEMLFFPIIARKEILAILLLFREPEDSERYLERVQSFLSDMKAAIENVATVRMLRELTIKDDTADCHNRRYFDSYLMDEISRASRFSLPLSIVFFDIDNLKDVNSQYSHSAGSRMLFEIALRAKAGIRKIDKLFRYGGDEFCVVLPETDCSGALEVAERLRDVISRKPFLVNDTGGINMTASFGVASFPLHAETKEELIIQADRAMQRIKELGKNSISVAEKMQQ